LQAMPIASHALDTVYLDIVGEIIPSSAVGHCWILTMIDSATRFFIAVPMRNIASVSVGRNSYEAVFNFRNSEGKSSRPCIKSEF